MWNPLRMHATPEHLCFTKGCNIWCMTFTFNCPGINNQILNKWTNNAPLKWCQCKQSYPTKSKSTPSSVDIQQKEQNWPHSRVSLLGIFVDDQQRQQYLCRAAAHTHVERHTFRYATQRYLCSDFQHHYTGRSPGHAVGMAGCGCGHSKIARVRAYYLYCMWLAVLTSLQILTVMKYWVTRNESLAITKY